MSIINKYHAVLTGIIVFIVYLFTLAPSVIQIDSGELAAVQITLGIAHPTGYPLFTILGYLFSLLPLPVAPILQANLLSAIYCSASIIFFTSSFGLVLNNIQNAEQLKVKNVAGTKKRDTIPSSKIELPGWVLIFISVFGSITLAFSRTFWMQSTAVEVYSLHILLISIIIHLLVKIIFSHEDDSRFQQWFFVALLFGLSFSNHMTTLLLIPGALYVYLVTDYKNKYSLKDILKLAMGFIATLAAVYSYLPIRASFNPILNWGNPVNLDNFIRHVSGAQYRVWLFSSFEAAKKQFINFFTALPDEFTIPVLIIAIIGLIYSFRINKKLFTFLVICFSFTVLYSSNYDIKDLETYFILAYISLSFFVIVGAYRIIKEFFNREIKSLVWITLFVLVGGYEFILNIDSTNQNDVYIFEDYTKALIKSTDEDAIILSYQWDYFLSASYYFQYCEDLRKDVVVIDKELLRRSWYYSQLRNNNQNLFNGYENDIKDFLTALKPFEENRNYDSNRLEFYYQSIMTNLVKYNIDDHPVYIGPELVENEMKNNQFKLPEGYSIVPDLFLFKVRKDNKYTPADDPDFKLRIPEDPNFYHKFIENIAVKMLLYRILYEIRFSKLERAKVYANKILNDFPDYSLPDNIKKTLSL